MTPSELVPFVDLQAQHRSLRADIDRAISRVISESSFILGPEVEAFEREFATYLGADNAVGLSSGTDAIHLALKAMGIGPGDEVIVPAFTFIATASGVSMSGATPVFADIDRTTFLLSPADTARRVTSRTRAIVPVHLYGQALDLAPFQELARRHDLRLIEDACQAHGARVGDRKVGTLGDVGCFSFYPSKNLGALGDGGLAVAADPGVAGRIRQLSHHGQATKNVHSVLGYTNRLDGLQAAILRAKLPHLDAWNAGRRAAAARYTQELEKLDVVVPRSAMDADHVFHVYAIRCARRDQLLERFAKLGIQAAVHYPTPVHRQPAYAHLAGSESLPESERAAAEVVSLPMFAEITAAQQARVVDAIRAHLD